MLLDDITSNRNLLPQFCVTRYRLRGSAIIWFAQRQSTTETDCDFPTCRSSRLLELDHSCACGRPPSRSPRYCCIILYTSSLPPMLSQTLSVPPPEGSVTPEPSTRRRGLSYLRNLSSHSSSAGGSDQPRISPRHFFQRSTSYNESTKARSATGRRRSTSKPDEPVGLSLDRQSLPITRVLSAGNSPVVPQTTLGDDNSSGEETRATRVQEQDQGITDTDDMARTTVNGVRRATDGAANAVRPAIAARAVSSNDVTSFNTPNGANGADDSKTKAPTIRFFPHQDFRNGRQSLNFSTVSRTLPSEESIIKVGRYSEREGLPVANPTSPSDAPVGFKSKVVSRKHCEFSCVNGQWHIKDVASSSGTFLNHIRLSQPNQESRLFPIKDGDIVQLGIDFRGGEEMIFRCVKIRIECNRSWQKKPNNFKYVLFCKKVFIANSQQQNQACTTPWFDQGSTSSRSKQWRMLYLFGFSLGKFPWYRQSFHLLY